MKAPKANKRAKDTAPKNHIFHHNTSPNFIIKNIKIVPTKIAEAIAADRTTANDNYIMAGLEGGQIISAIVEEA